MKIHSLQTSSMPAGAALTCLVLLALGFQRVASVSHFAAPVPGQMVHVLPGGTYTVPTGKLFVTTGVTPVHAGGSLTVSMRFDGQVVLAYPAVVSIGGASVPTIAAPVAPSIPPGLSAPAGTVITAFNGTLLGYLADG